MLSVLAYRSRPWLAACAAVLALGADARKGQRVSGPMAARAFPGDVFEAHVSPDGTRVVFRADAETDGAGELYSAPLDGSAAPLRLNAPIVTGGTLRGFRIAPDSERVVFWGDLATDDKFEVFSAPIDVGSAQVKLNAPLDPGGDVVITTLDPGVRISPDSSRVVYLASSAAGVHELYSVPIDASAPAVKLNGPLAAGGDVGLFLSTDVPFLPGFEVGPDSLRVVYLADQDTDGLRELYSVPLHGGPATKLNHPIPLGSYVGSQSPDLGTGYRISPDGQRVTYLVKYSTQELFSVPIDGSLPAVKLNATLPSPSSRVQADYRISADSTRVVYRADQTSYFLFELYSVPIDGSAPAQELSDVSAFPGVEPSFQISATHAVYRVADELRSVPLDGSAPPLGISGPLPLRSLDVPLRITADGSRVLYRSAQASSKVELYGVPVAGGSPPVRLNSPLVHGGGVLEFALAPAGDRAVYRANGDLFGIRELYSVPVDASAAAVKLNAPLVPTGDVESVAMSDFIPDFEISPDGTRVVYLADQENPNVVELFSVPIDASAAPTRLNGDLGTPTVAGDVTGFVLAAAGEHAVYRADQDDDEVFELHGLALPRSPAEEPAPSVRLSGPDHNVLLDFGVSPDGERVVYVASRDDIVFTREGTELFSAPVDGSAPAVRISQPLARVGRIGNFTGYFAISPDSSRVVYVADGHRTETVELFSVPIDGSAAPTRLNAPFAIVGVTPSGGRVELPLERAVQRFRISPDGTRVVYEADQDQPGVLELYSVPIDGSQPPRRLHPRVDQGHVALVAITPDAGRVLFFLDGALRSVPIDGGAGGAVLFGPPLFLAGCSPLLVTPDSARVVFAAREQSSEVEGELFSVPVDGSQPPVKLSGPFPSGAGGIYPCGGAAFEIAPDGERVVYRADHETGGVVELHVVPVDGSGAPVRLSGALAPAGSVVAFAVGREHVVYAADQAADEVHELFAVPLDGSAPPVRLNGPLVSGGDVGTFALSPDGMRVLYSADQRQNEVFELFAVSLRAGASAVVNGPLGPGGDVRLPGFSNQTSGAFACSGSRALYVADQDENEVHELYLSFLAPAVRPR